MKIISGCVRLGTRSHSVAGSRLRSLEKILNQHGLFFPPLFHGTLNIKLTQVFETPADSIFIPAAELDSIVPQPWGEDWKLVPVDQINGIEMTGYILRAGQKAHPDDVAELITSDLRDANGIDISFGAQISLRIESAESMRKLFILAGVLVLVFSLVPFSFSKTDSGSKVWTQKIVDLALHEKGTYYLTYQLYPSQSQIRYAYPKLDSFFEKKKFYDPAELFMNKFYENYKNPVKKEG